MSCLVKPKAHPGKKCQECSKCGIKRANRWYHNINKPSEFLSWLQDNHSLGPFDCLCPCCNIWLERKYVQPPPPKKKRSDTCQICPNKADHVAEISNPQLFSKVMGIHIIENSLSCPNTNTVNLCQQHYSRWREERFHGPTCHMPGCKNRLKRNFRMRHFYLIKHYFEDSNEHQFSHLDEKSSFCKKCFMILLKLKASLGKDGGIDEDSIDDSVDPNTDEDLDTKSFLYSKLDDFKDIQSKLSSDTNTNVEAIVLNEILMVVANSMIREEPLLLPSLLTKFNDKLDNLYFDKNIEKPVNACKTSFWLLLKLENAFGQYIKIHQYKKNGYLEAKKGTLILAKDADLISIIHNMCYQMNQNSGKPIQVNSESSIPVCNQQDLSQMYENVIMDLNDRYQKQISYFKSHFTEIDLSKIDFNSIIKSFDSFIWNFHFLSSQTGRERRLLGSLPSIETSFFPEDMENDHKNRRILRTLFSICHNLYQVSAGECQHPLHILLADSLDSYSGSTKLVTMFNTFGIVCSKKNRKNILLLL